jgi:hypothetical protein
MKNRFPPGFDRKWLYRTWKPRIKLFKAALDTGKIEIVEWLKENFGRGIVNMNTFRRARTREYLTDKEFLKSVEKACRPKSSEIKFSWWQGWWNFTRLKY